TPPVLTAAKGARLEPTWASRYCIEAEPLPESYSVERSTVATPFLALTPRRVVPSGMAVEIWRSPDSSFVGPARSAVIAAFATAVDLGTSRSTGTRPTLPGPPPRMKYARTSIVSVVAGVAVVLVGAAGDPDASADGSVDGLTLALGPGVRSGLVGSAEAVGAEVGTDPRRPVAPLQAATSETTVTSTRAMRTGKRRVMGGLRLQVSVG